MWVRVSPCQPTKYERFYNIISNLKDKIIELRNSGKTYKQISKELNCAKSTVSYHCVLNKIGNNIGNTRRLTIEEKENLQVLYDKFKSIKKVAKETGISSGTVFKYVKCDKNKKSSSISKSDLVINWRKRKKLDLVEYKGGKCEICGYSKSINALQFHHKNKEEKDFSISGKSLSFDKLKKEVDKCILVCANCHIEIHEKLYNENK